MTTRGTFTFLLLLTGTAYSAPTVTESLRPDGMTELLIRSEAGQALATYRVDLKSHHEPAASDTGTIRRWEEYRYGGFFCFNDNQFTGGEYSRNTDPRLYNPTNLDVAGWAAAMKGAGMRYAVLTTRHTSGFLLWDSASTDFDVAGSGNTTDVCRAFADECRKAGIAPGFYYCLWGGHGWGPNPNARAIILAQVHELATRFGEIPYFWIDMPTWRPADLSVREIYDAIKNDQPNSIVIINHGINGSMAGSASPSDIINGEVTVPPEAGYDPFRRANGKRCYLPFEFEPVSQRIAKGTTTPAGPVGAWFTFGAGRNFPASEPLPAPLLFDWIKSAYDRGAHNVLLSLAADHTGSMRPDDVRILTQLGAMLREAGLLEPAAPRLSPPESLALAKPARASGVWDGQVDEYGPAAAFDGDPATRWGGARGSTSGWLEVDLGAVHPVSRAVIREGWDRVRRFSVQYRAGDAWHDAATGTTVGAQCELHFPAVTAQVFRLNVTEAIDVPTIWEFELFTSPANQKGTTP